MDKILRQIEDLKHRFDQHGTNQAGLRHVLIVCPDDRNDLVTGPSNMVSSDSRSVNGPDVNGRLVGIQPCLLFERPRMTSEGKGIYLPLGGYNITPEAREAFIAEPGLVATSIMVYEGPADGKDNRTLFETLAKDAVRCLRELGEKAADFIPDELESLQIQDSGSWWLMLLHRLAWAGDKNSFLQANRSTWIKTEKASVYVEYEAACLADALPLPPDFEKALKEQVSNPPRHFVSTLEKDVFTSSALALGILLQQLTSQKSCWHWAISFMKTAWMVMLGVFALIGAIASAVGLYHYIKDGR